MQKITRTILSALIVSAACGAMHAGWAQDRAAGGVAQTGDPARWYQEDMTPRARFQTLQKEAGAAYRESQAECKKVERAMHAACMQEARRNFNQDMSDARRQLQTS